MIYDVAVIGLGVVGQVALAEFVASEATVVAIDEFHLSSDVRVLRDLVGRPSTWTKGTRISGFPGGRSNWGKNCSIVTIDNHQPLGPAFESRLLELTRRLKKYGFPRLKPVKIPKTGSNRFYVREAKDFSGQKWLSEIKTNKNIFFENGFVKEIIQEDNDVLKLIVKKPGHNLKEIFVKKVLICSGPFGTQELLARSGLISHTTAKIWDHISYSLGTLNLNQPSLAKFGMFGWNRCGKINYKRCSTFYEESTEILWTLRIFPDGLIDPKKTLVKIKAMYKSRMIAEFLKTTFTLIISLITGKLIHESIKIHIAADFLNAKNALATASFGSNGVIECLEYEINEIKLSSDFWKFVNYTIKNLNLKITEQFQLIIKESLSYSDVHSSSHHMGTVDKNNFDTSISPLAISNKIFVAGSAAFHFSVPGHPTMLAAATAIEACDTIKKNL